MYNSIKKKAYYRTRHWIAVSLINSHKKRTKKNWYSKVWYTLDELKDWLYSQDNFEDLYNKWVNSWYERQFAISIDRINDYKWYSFDNIQLMICKENVAKWNRDRKNWINNKMNTKILQLYLGWAIKSEFYSTMEAERQTGIDHSLIHRVCRGAKYSKTAWWYKWAFKDK
jgi:hypothetical protein